jgi:hypothetical protein
LGAEVFGSLNEQKVVYHTCKSRACPSCGHRATIQWLRERWVALPDVPYKGITFTMPDVLWPLFRDNRHLARALAPLAATVIQNAAMAKASLIVGVIAILHTFNGPLEFNSHVHTMVTAGGLHPSGRWVPSIYYDDLALMEAWKNSVIQLLRTALHAGRLRNEMTLDEAEAAFARQEERDWILKIQWLGSKEHFLRYAGRYVRRPPIAQRRITYIGETSVTYWAKDKKLGRRVEITCSLEEFIDRWAQHIPDRYQNAVRGFGLFAPRSISEYAAAVFALLGQNQMPRPRPQRWADSIMRDFGWNPLLDSTGSPMTWLRRLAPSAP